MFCFLFLKDRNTRQSDITTTRSEDNIQLNEFLIVLNIKYDIIRHNYFVLYIPIYRLTKIMKRFHVQNCPRGTVGAKIGYVLVLLVHGQVVVEFGRKVFLVDCLL